MASEPHDRLGFENLSQINLDDMCNAIGLTNRLLKTSLTPFLKPHAQKLAKEVLSFDADIKTKGLQEASKRFCSHYTANVTVTGLEYLPAKGPLLILSNHPGLFDTVSLFSQIERTELKVIALDRSFLRSMPALSESLFFVGAQKTALLRKLTRHLQMGGSILTFPAGKIEPDPYLREGTLASVATWSESIVHLKRMVPDLSIVVAMVAGVFNKQLLSHPLLKIRQTTDGKELLAATLQIAAKRYQTNTIDIVFSEAFLDDDQDMIKTLLMSKAKECLDSLAEHRSDTIYY